MQVLKYSVILVLINAIFLTSFYLTQDESWPLSFGSLSGSISVLDEIDKAVLSR